VLEADEQELQQFLQAWNENPKPFVWTATVDSIVEKLLRCRQTLEQIQPGSTASPAQDEEQTEEMSCPVISWTLH